MKQYLWLLTFLPLLTGCSSGLPVESNNYSPEQVEGRTLLLIAPVLDSVFVYNNSDVEDDFPDEIREPRAVVRSVFYAGVIKNLSEILRERGNCELETDATLTISARDTANLVFGQFFLGKDKVPFHFYRPKKEWLISKGKSPDIVAIITSLTFGRNISNPSGGHFMAGQTISTPGGSFTTPGMFVGGGGGYSTLNGVFGFIIYDYKAEKWITYGFQRTSYSISLWGLSRSGWDACFKEAANKLLVNSPWEKGLYHPGIY